jgi:hypothetical protein
MSKTWRNKKCEQNFNWDFRFTWRWVWIWQPSGILRRFVEVDRCFKDAFCLHQQGDGNDDGGKIQCLCLGSNSGRPVCSQTLYWLSCRENVKIIMLIPQTTLVLFGRRRYSGLWRCVDSVGDSTLNKDIITDEITSYLKLQSRDSHI